MAWSIAPLQEQPYPDFGLITDVLNGAGYHVDDGRGKSEYFGDNCYGAGVLLRSARRKKIPFSEMNIVFTAFYWTVPS